MVLELELELEPVFEPKTEAVALFMGLSVTDAR